jgi:hypothetical protein
VITLVNDLPRAYEAQLVGQCGQIVGEGVEFVPRTGIIGPAMTPAQNLPGDGAAGGTYADEVFTATAGKQPSSCPALPSSGPIREYYLVGQRETADTAQWRTEIGWPVYLTGTAPDRIGLFAQGIHRVYSRPHERSADPAWAP